ncbi:DUF3265 domain-containing protein [Photobacterium damselae subsp. damselae]|nr:DUF3265 domain-containing protein [Photobacterium damselae subsp. damselae]
MIYNMRYFNYALRLMFKVTCESIGISYLNISICLV